MDYSVTEELLDYYRSLLLGRKVKKSDRTSCQLEQAALDMIENHLVSLVNKYPTTIQVIASSRGSNQRQQDESLLSKQLSWRKRQSVLLRKMEKEILFNSLKTVSYFKELANNRCSFADLCQVCCFLPFN